MQNPDFRLFPSPPIPLLYSDILTVSPSLGGWMEESEGKRRRRQKRKREGVDVLFSSAECARMYERRSIYFRTCAWVYTDLKHTHAHTHTKEML